MWKIHHPYVGIPGKKTPGFPYLCYFSPIFPLFSGTIHRPSHTLRLGALIPEGHKAAGYPTGEGQQRFAHQKDPAVGQVTEADAQEGSSCKAPEKEQDLEIHRDEKRIKKRSKKIHECWRWTEEPLVISVINVTTVINVINVDFSEENCNPGFIMIYRCTAYS